jgi:hypothetical protein
MVTPQGHVTRINEMYSNTTWVDWDVCVVFQGWGDTMTVSSKALYWGSNTHIALVYGLPTLLLPKEIQNKMKGNFQLIFVLRV